MNFKKMSKISDSIKPNDPLLVGDVRDYGYYPSKDDIVEKLKKRFNRQMCLRFEAFEYWINEMLNGTSYECSFELTDNDTFFYHCLFYKKGDEEPVAYLPLGFISHSNDKNLNELNKMANKVNELSTY